MFQEYMRRIVIDLCLVVAIFFNFYYLSTTHFDFMISLFHYQMYNVSALAYTLLRFVYMLIPVFLLVPSMGANKAERIRKSFYLLGICYVLGSTWIFYFIAQKPISLLWTNPEAARDFLQLNALNSDYLIWDSYDLFGIFFSMIQAAVYIFIGYNITRHRRLTIKLYWVSVALSMLLPLIYVTFIGEAGQFSSLWLRKNTVLFTSGLFTGIGLTLASGSRGMWNEMLWK